jgi:hypothetical protein
MGAIIILLGDTGSFNDMSQIIYYGLRNLLNGQNPYAFEYVLHWGEGTFSQPLNYGPVSLLLFLPAMIIPRPYDWIRCMWIGAFIINNFYCFLISETVRLCCVTDLTLQKNRKINLSSIDPRENRILYYFSVFFWMYPFGSLIVTVFLWMPMWLCLMAFVYRDRPMIAGLFISMAAMTYQLCFLFLPVYAIYAFKKSFRECINFAIGCIPAVIILIVFEIWPPGGAIDSLFLYTSRMGYIKCDGCEGILENLYGSIPKIVYVASGGKYQIGEISRWIMFSILGFICVIYFFTNKFDKDSELFMNNYFVFATILFTLTTNYGGVHYLLMGFVPVFIILQIKYPDYRKSQPIGQKIKNYVDFELSVQKTHRLPL